MWWWGVLEMITRKVRFSLRTVVKKGSKPSLDTAVADATLHLNKRKRGAHLCCATARVSIVDSKVSKGRVFHQLVVEHVLHLFRILQ